MRGFFRVVVWGLVSLVVLASTLAALFGYYVYSPAPEVPRLSGTLTRGAIETGGPKRTYATYVPEGLPRGSPLVVVMHGSGESAAHIRVESGYGFERLADERGFAVVYPNAYEGYWDACSIVGEVRANALEIDDIRFLTNLVDRLIMEIGADPGRVFATGGSRGGSMALRLALEAPARFRAVAAVSASVPTPDNFKCTAGQPTSSVMIMNGTEDPLVPFNGGEVNLFRFFYRNGTVLSSRASAQFFADLNHIAGAPDTSQAEVAGGVRLEQLLWRNESNVEVEFVAIHGGGHGIPQPYRRGPRLLGPSPKEPNGPAVIWSFFERQRR